VLGLLRNRRFGLLWLGGLLSLTGDWILFAGLPLAVYELTDSTLATGGLFIAATVPRVVLGSVAGVLVDRWDRRRVLVVSNLALAVALLPLLAVRSEDSVWVVYVVAVVVFSLALLVAPAEGALLPRLVGEDLLVPANALNALNNQIARLVGPAIGGLVVGFFGLGAVAILDALSFVAAAALIGLIKVDARPERSEPLPGQETIRIWASLWREWLDGLYLLRRTESTRVLLFFAAITGVGEGVIITLFVPFATDVLEGGGPLYGALLSAQAIGGLIGGVLLGFVGSRLPPSRLLALSAIVFGLVDLVIFTYPAFLEGYALALALMVVVGVPAAALGAAFNTLMQTAVGDAFRGRLIGAVGTTTALTMLAGMIVASVLGDHVGVIPLLVIQAAAYPAFGLVALSRGWARRGPSTPPGRSATIDTPGEL
jgi:MFS family permease